MTTKSTSERELEKAEQALAAHVEKVKELVCLRNKTRGEIAELEPKVTAAKSRADYFDRKKQSDWTVKETAKTAAKEAADLESQLAKLKANSVKMRSDYWDRTSRTPGLQAAVSRAKAAVVTQAAAEAMRPLKQDCKTAKALNDAWLAWREARPHDYKGFLETLLDGAHT